MTEFLGQDLTRTALSEESLAAFAAPLDHMRDQTVPLRERADAFKAVRFGLVGVAIQGWEKKITTDLSTPMRITPKHALHHHFSPLADIKPHDPTVVHDGNPEDRIIVQSSQGAFAFGAIQKGLSHSWAEHLTDQDAKYKNIPVPEIIATLTDSINEARTLGLFDVPDVYKDGEPLWEGFKHLLDDEQELHPYHTQEILSSTGRNPTRFISHPITKAMEHYVDNPADQEEVNRIVYGIMQHAARVSQSHSFSNRVISQERRRPCTMSVDINGRPELTWEDKHAKPFRQLGPRENPPQDENVRVTRRNKCPVGYTEDASKPQPISKIYSAVMHHLIKNDLHVPSKFVAAKNIYHDTRL